MRTDDQILDNVIRGEQHAFRVLVNEYQDLVYTLCLKVVKNREQAEEAAQDVFVKVYRKLHQFDRRSSLKTWIYRIAHRTAIDYYRKKGLANVADDDLVPVVSKDQTADDRLMGIDRNEAIQTAMQELKELDARILDLYYFDELNIEEVAKILTLSISNCKVRLHRARKRLGELLLSSKYEEHGFGY